jgi:hypothetical protein
MPMAVVVDQNDLYGGVLDSHVDEIHGVTDGQGNS